jgi:farnesyl diphosphate synthase
MIDQSYFRRGRLCWYKKDGVGLTAINDAFFVEACIYTLLEKYFREQEYYMELVEDFQQTTFVTIGGEGLELLMGQEKGAAGFTADVYNSIVKYKTSFYTFVLPMNLAMTMAGIRDNRMRERVRDLMLEMGYLLQVKNDYFDVFGNPEDTGKIGSDITGNTCSWLVVSALEKATDEQRKIILENYGQKSLENVNAIKELYIQLRIPEYYQKFKDDKYRSINKQIDELPPELPIALFRGIAYELYSHSC